MNSPQIIRFGPRKELYGALHAPRTAAGRGLVICAPFGEEAKCAYRPLYEMADLAAANGWIVLRLDYLGTGNSDGGFEGFCLSRAREDIQAAIACLQERHVENIGLLGLGLGAGLAYQTAAQGRAEFLVMWQPTVNGEQFYRLNIKRRLIRQMLTHGKAKGGQTRDDIVDLDGYPLRKETVEELKALNLLDCAPADLPPTLLLQISFTRNMASDLAALADACRPALQTECIVCEPFWNRIGFVDCSAVYDATLRWLDQR